HIQVGQSVLVFSAGPGGSRDTTDLAQRISLIAKGDLELSSAIVKSIGEGEGSRILARPDQAQSVWLQGALAHPAVMYEATQAVSHILDVGQLLDRILELIFRSIEADRGCFMLLGADDARLEPRAVRTRGEADDQERIVVSRTVTDHVLRERQGVLVSDAASDDRFAAGQSIVRFGIREVICAPMKGRHETLGVLYLHTRSNAREV